MLDAKRALGQYSTPPLTVDYMIRLVQPYLTDTAQPRILDPAVGDGVFIRALLQKGIPGHALYAVDIDAGVLPRLNASVNVSHQDFLTLNDGNFDVIIGNPPYKSKRQSDYIRQHRGKLEAQFRSVGIQNMYSMFVVHAIQNLREGGALCLIVQDSFLTNVYYREFRSFILENCKIKLITLAPRRLFHGANADVRTAIVLLEKCSGSANDTVRCANIMTLVDRLQSEREYDEPPTDKTQKLEQSHFVAMPNQVFAVNVPERIHEIFRTSKTFLGEVVRGGTGISTGNDAKFLRKIDEVEPNEAAEWVPFYKNGGKSDAWFYHTPFRIRHDWESPSQTYKDFMTRNAEFYFREGITCSSMGASFSAAYLPEGCLFGVNTNLFADSRTDLFYILGFLNSCLAKYMVRAVLNRTNMVTAGYVKRLPYIEPDERLKSRVSDAAESAVDRLRRGLKVDYGGTQEIIDDAIFHIYGIGREDAGKIQSFCEDLFESL